MKFVKTIVIGAAMAAASTAFAGAPLSGEPVSKAVRFADLDLSSTEGVSALYRRLHNAAESVCSSLKGASARTVVAYRDCRTEAVQSAVSRINAPMLTRHHQLKTGSAATLAAR